MYFPLSVYFKIAKNKTRMCSYPDSDCTSLGHTTLVPRTLKALRQESSTTAQGKRNSNMSKNLVHPLIVESPLKFRIITKSRWKKTLSNYESHWRKWVNWCLEQKIDSFQASVKEIIEYLTFLFNYLNDYRAINLHRSAISDFHEYTDGLLVGNDPSLGFVNWCLVYLVCL